MYQRRMKPEAYQDDIPIAIANTALVHDPHGPPTILSRGRSSRVIFPESADPTGSAHLLADDEIKALKAQGFTTGLIHCLIRNNQMFPLRFWIVDNSGSMFTADGHRTAESLSAHVVKLVQCSRWNELQQTVEYHARMARLMRAPTVFRLLNDPGRLVGPQQFSVAERQGLSAMREDLHVALNMISKTSPSGCTPLSEHIYEIRENILAMLPQLQATGQMVAIILATDGLPSDSHGRCDTGTCIEFENHLLSLAGLPVWIVVRLCTDEDLVVEYYNYLDNQLELSLEVLDDWVSEGKEVYRFNPWLNYGQSLHRCREMGFHHRLFDLLDERKLSIDEMREFFVLLFGPDAMDGVPDPNLDFNGFCYAANHAIQKEGKVWNPVTQKMSYWVDMKKLKRCYSRCCIIM